MVKYDVYYYYLQKEKLRHNIIFYFYSRFQYPSQSIVLQHVVHTGNGPSGVAVDSTNDHVYWVYDGGNTLSRCKSDGTNVVVVSNSLSSTFMISLDITNRYDILIIFKIVYCQSLLKV